MIINPLRDEFWAIGNERGRALFCALVVLGAYVVGFAGMLL